MKDCTLIATLPSINNRQKIVEIMSNPCISEVRYNTGASSPFSVEDTLMKLQELSLKYNKKLWIDLKGRQLRVTKWADPRYECITLNHKVNLTGPSIIFLRNGEGHRITNVVNGNQIYIENPPRHAVGAGQSVNIVSDFTYDIDGYFTMNDLDYILACQKMGIKSFMLSFVECLDDTADILKIIKNPELVLKIESYKGLELVKNCVNGVNLMAARDDLYIQTGLDMIDGVKDIIKKDQNAICASRIFSSLEHNDTPDFCDFEDLEYMYQLGYRRFMLCDNVCNYAFDRAIRGWERWIR